MSLLNYYKNIKPLIRWSKLLFTPLAVIFFCYISWHSRPYINDLFKNARYSWLLGSIILWATLHLISPLFTSELFNSFSLKLHYKKAIFIHTSRLPAKYIPGGIWHSVARAGDYYKKGITARQVGSYLLLENIIAVSTTLFLGGIIVTQIDRIDTLWLLFSLVCSMISIITIILLPQVISTRLLKIEAPINTFHYIRSICFIFIYWIVAGISFIFYLQSFPDLLLGVSILEIAGIYLFSWGIGFITIFAPQGIGVSEVVISQLLGTGLDIGNVIVIIAGFRIIVLIADILTWILSISISTLSKLF